MIRSFTRFRLLTLGIPLLLPLHCLTISLFPIARSIKIESEPSVAEASLYDEGELIDRITTPGRIYLYRVRNLTLKVSKPGYETATVPIRFTESPLRIGISGLTSAVCGFWPAGIDLLTGAAEVPRQDVYSVVLEPEDGSKQSLRIQVVTDRSEILVY